MPTTAGSTPATISPSPAITTPPAWAGGVFACGTTTGSRRKSGFPPHPHRDMEIVTYVRTGAITHQDSMGNKGRTAAGDVQVMSAGTGVTHAEFNLEDEATTLFQIWIETDKPSAQVRAGARSLSRRIRAKARFSCSPAAMPATAR